MKKIFLAVVALAAMTACSNDEFVSVDRAPINFGEAFVDNATRAADTTYGAVALTSFNVYGTVKGQGVTNPVNIFDGDNVTGTVGENEWNYVDEDTKAEYWVVGAAYNFAAVVNATVVEATKTSAGMPTQLKAVVDDADENNSNLKDMLYAAASVPSASANQDAVDFTFEHLLSKVQFTVTSNAKGDYSHSVTGITVKNFSDATYTIESGAWSTFNTDPTAVAIPDKDVNFLNIEGVNAASKENIGTTDEINGKTNATQMLLIPTDDEFEVSFTVKVLKNGTEISSDPQTIKVNKDLVKGNAYNFTIACELNSPIKFSVADDLNWANGGELNVQ